MAEIPGQTLKILWHLSNEIYTDIHLLVSCGERQFGEMSLESLDGKKYQIVNVYLFVENKD